LAIFSFIRTKNAVKFDTEFTCYMYTDTELHREERLCLTRDRRPGSTRHQLFNLSLQVLVQQGGG